jgi:hypothetical protein
VNCVDLEVVALVLASMMAGRDLKKKRRKKEKA